MATTDPVLACTQIVHRFFACLDEVRPEDGAALFIEDGVWRKRGAPIQGRAAILESMRSRGADVATRHLVTNMIVEPDGPDMMARYYVTTFADEAWSGGVAALETPMVVLACEDRLSLTPEGWRFAARSSRPVFARR